MASRLISAAACSTKETAFPVSKHYSIYCEECILFIICSKGFTREFKCQNISCEHKQVLNKSKLEHEQQQRKPKSTNKQIATNSRVVKDKNCTRGSGNKTSLIILQQVKSRECFYQIVQYSINKARQSSKYYCWSTVPIFSTKQ